MNIRRIIICCCTLLFLFNTQADGVKVRKAWARTFPDLSLTILPDNLGHIAAVGNEIGPDGMPTNAPVALLLNAHGKELAKVSVPIPRFAGAAADQAGRIFVMGNEYPSVTIHCAAFEPLLSDVLWVQTNNIGYHEPPPGLHANLGALTPDEAGGLFAFGDWQRGVFMTRFHSQGSEIEIIFEPFSTPDRTAAAVVRSFSGDVFFVGNAASFRNFWITVLKWNSTTGDRIAYGRTSPGINGYAAARAAACDSQGNLIIVGRYIEWYADVSRRGRCFTLKLDPTGNVIWQVHYGPYDSISDSPGITGLAVAVDPSNNIIMTGTAGTVKYSPDGQVLWEFPDSGALQLDPSGHVLLARSVAGADGIAETEITKLNADGTLRWRTRFDDGTASGNWTAGLVIDERGDVYFGARSEGQTSIVKLVELPRRPATHHNQTRAPQTHRPELTGSQPRTPNRK